LVKALNLRLEILVARFEVGERVFHLREGDNIARRGYGRILKIEGTRAMLAWEAENKEGGVERRDLISEDQAPEEGLA
jgi:hypothetical protein